MAHQPRRTGTWRSILRTKLRWSSCSWKYTGKCTGWRWICNYDIWRRCSEDNQRRSHEGFWYHPQTQRTWRQAWYRYRWYRWEPCCWYEIPWCIWDSWRNNPDGSSWTARRTHTWPWDNGNQEETWQPVRTGCLRRKMVHTTSWSNPGIRWVHSEICNRWS